MFKLLEDARQFLRTKQWYDDLGIPYRRGYLLHGEPGSGKTSAVLAIAGELGLDVYMLNLGDRFLDDGRLNCLLSQVPPGNIVLLEDIDAAFKAREALPSNRACEPGEPPTRSHEIEQTAVTFSGLLNALDGVAAREGRVLFMTTNHRAFLDPALIRPGRADLHAEFGLATQDQARRMFLRFFPLAPDEMAVRFGELTPENTLAMATIQDHLLTHKADPAVALDAWTKTRVPEAPK